jgi:hypothetical protein
MKVTIDSEIVGRAEKCKKEQQCLENGKRQVCPPEYQIPKNGLFIKRLSMDSCPYMIAFGNSHVCNCPVREELYSRYSI